MLEAEIPMLVITHAQLCIGWPQARRSRRRQCASEEEISHRSNRRSLVVERSLVEFERDHVVVDTAIRIFRFIENAITATQNSPLSERPPGKAYARRPLVLVRRGDGHRQPRLAAGLDEIFEERERGWPCELRAQVNLIAATADDDRLGQCGVEGPK